VERTLMRADRSTRRKGPALVFAFAALLAWHGLAAAQPRAVVPRGELDPEERATIALFERARDSVVFISTRQQVRDLFSRNVYSVPRGTGSGFIWDGSGHVVTNFHVIQGASGATVRLADGRDHPAELVGVSPAHDIAVLRIAVKVKPPPPVPLGSSDDLRVGQKVYAIGNPFGLDWSLTTGVVSALDRSLPTESGINIEHLIQTDAAINPGNSGGPLLDSAGRLIGMNTAIYSPSGASAGIGFAVPADTINRVVPQLVRSGKYVRPVLGVEADDSVNQRLARQQKIRGVVILKVTPNSAAAKAGLRAATIARDGSITPGDIIVEIQGQPVDNVGKLIGRLDDFKAGETIRLGILRDGAKIEVRATLQPGK
jgi:S1-C subfamily serine protease